ncbi:MAG TPA: hypothetical protein VE890_08730, partial [Thermoguttaceae bacterium]|nr:hypothetical protein [Thermoguttaceae bacterium]
MQDLLRTALLISLLGILSGCTPEPSREPPQPPAAQPSTLEEPSVTAEQKDAALAVLQEINGTLKKDEAG